MGGFADFPVQLSSLGQSSAMNFDGTDAHQIVKECICCSNQRQTNVIQ